MKDSIAYKFKSGKPIKFFYFLSGFMKQLIPDMIFRNRLSDRLEEAARRPDYDYIRRRVDYYMKVGKPFTVSQIDRYQKGPGWIQYTGEIGKYRRKMFCATYFFDQYEVTKWFPCKLRWNFCPGDVYFTPEVPTVVKSRLLSSDNANSVILKLDKLRHFMFVQDAIPFREKKDMAVFRGKIRSSRVRTKFLKMFFGHPMFDCGVVGKNGGYPEKWMTSKKTIKEHLQYKFIMALEGNDVASNLKWVMSSNSLAVMTRPTCETWFMEGTLIPDYHYVEVKDDFSDLPDKLQYYIEHPDKAEDILVHAHDFVRQFRDKEREELISLFVADRYFRLSGQLPAERRL